jgi:c(7)-type cytochrome triheme protein
MRVAMVIVVALMAAVGFASAVDAQKLPAPIKFPLGTDSPGAVTFDHAIHKEANEKCTVCHTKIFKMKTGTSGNLTMEKMHGGESCATCHNGKTQVKGKPVFAIDDCQKCHKP